MKRSFLSVLNASALIASVVLTGRLTAQASQSTLPHLVRKDGRHALIVDGAPFLILGGQSHNSSAWPKALPKVWSAIVTRRPCSTRTRGPSARSCVTSRRPTRSTP